MKVSWTVFVWVLGIVAIPCLALGDITEVLAIRHNTSQGFKNFKDPPLGFQFKLYFFNVTNPQDFRGNLNDLKFDKVGPYVYDERRYKEVIEFNDTFRVEVDGNKTVPTVSYMEQKEYIFNEEISQFLSHKKLTKDDQLTLLNMGLGLPAALLPILHLDQLTLTDTVDNFAFKGSAQLLGHAIFKHIQAEHTVDTGNDNVNNILNLYKYGRNVDASSFWSSTKHSLMGTCKHKLHGTDGTQFQPDIWGGDSLYVYEPSQCRTVKLGLLYGNPDHKHKDIITWRFMARESNYEKNHENECFCYEDNIDDCPAGVFNLRGCPPLDGYHMETIISQPFFFSNPALLADSGLAPLVDNETLTRENYETYYDIEHITGRVVSSWKWSQWNVLLRKNKIPLLSNLAKNMLIGPIVIVEEVAYLKDEAMEELRNMTRTYSRN